MEIEIKTFELGGVLKKSSAVFGCLQSETTIKKPIQSNKTITQTQKNAYILMQIKE